MRRLDRQPQTRVDGAVMDLHGLASGLEHQPALDRAAAALDRVVPELVRREPWRDRLAGTWLGHALHPMLTDVPLGTWMSATLLDVLGAGRWRWASTTLTGVGLAAAAPTVATGVVEWLDTDRERRRVGVVHAAANGAAATCYLASFVAKLSGRTRLGAVASVAGGAASVVGGYLGGHLSLARGVGVDHTSGHRTRRAWFEVHADGEQRRGTAAAHEPVGERFLVTRTATGRIAVPDRCTRCGASLAAEPSGLLACERDGSRFDALAGRVARGPATTPLPTFEVAEGADGLRLRNID